MGIDFKFIICFPTRDSKCNKVENIFPIWICFCE